MNEMTVTSAQYVNDTAYGINNASIIAIIDGTEMSIPLDPDNRHYAEIMRQVDAGTLTIQDAD